MNERFREWTANHADPIEREHATRSDPLAKKLVEEIIRLEQLRSHPEKKAVLLQLLERLTHRKMSKSEY